MEMHRGTSRISLVGEKYTLKIPKITTYIVGSVLQVLKQHKAKGYTIDTTMQRLGNEMQFWYNKNIENIRANRGESRLGKQYPELVMSTKFSLMGIVNIQETGEIIEQDINNELWKLMIKYSHDHNNCIREGHTFYEGGNFARDRDGKIKLVDAGSTTMGDTLSIEAENISKAIKEIEERY